MIRKKSWARFRQTVSVPKFWKCTPRNIFCSLISSSIPQQSWWNKNALPSRRWGVGSLPPPVHFWSGVHTGDLVRKPALQARLLQLHTSLKAFLALLSSEPSLTNPASLPSAAIWQCIMAVFFMRPAIWNKPTLHLSILSSLIYLPRKNVITSVFENTTDVCVSVFALKIKSSKNASGPSKSHLGKHCNEELWAANTPSWHLLRCYK